MDDVLKKAEAWGFPVNLKQPSIPRPGYRTTIGAAFLTPTSSSTGPGSSDDRAPSGRFTMVRQIRSVLTWHLAALRLAPANVAITAAMGGVGLNLKKGRFVLAPFVEAGFGHVESRHDLGGYFAGAGKYVPSWDRVVGDGLGVGGGATLDIILFPRTMIEGSVGYWNFTMPLNAEDPEKLYVGAGVRLGL